VAIGASALIGCPGKLPDPPPPPPPPARSEVPAADVRVSLFWSALADLDLYVTDPALETVYFGNPNARSGGRLNHDVACSGISERGGPWVEDVAWSTAPRGRYRVGVDFIEPCAKEVEKVPFRVVVDIAGKRLEKTGTASHARFDPLVLEFEVP
jgi:hypothetical protein